MPQKVIPLPKVLIGNLLGHQLLHRLPQLRILLQIRRNGLRLGARIELLTPLFPIARRRLLRKTLGARMNDMQLRVEPARVDHPLARRVLALKEDLAVRGMAAVGGGDGHGVLEEVADVRAEPQQRLVGRVLGPLDVAQPLGGLGAQAAEDGLGLGEGFVRRELFGLAAAFDGGGRGRCFGGGGGGVGVVGEGEAPCAVDEGRLEAGEAALGFTADLVELLLGFLVDGAALCCGEK